MCVILWVSDRHWLCAWVHLISYHTPAWIENSYKLWLANNCTGEVAERADVDREWWGNNSDNKIMCVCSVKKLLKIIVISHLNPKKRGLFHSSSTGRHFGLDFEWAFAELFDKNTTNLHEKYEKRPIKTKKSHYFCCVCWCRAEDGGGV